MNGQAILQLVDRAKQNKKALLKQNDTLETISISPLLLIL